MLHGTWQNNETGEIRYVICESYGVGLLVGKLVVITGSEDSEDRQAHIKGDFLLRFSEVRKVAA